jgi:26S proteasome regulatory subunit N12
MLVWVYVCYNWTEEMSLLSCRDAVAECSEVSYESLSVSAAKNSLLLDSDDAVRRYAEEKHVDWKLDGGRIFFGKTGESKHLHSSDLPSLKLITESLSYATELERIV